jgi:hypothetical protein
MSTMLSVSTVRVRSVVAAASRPHRSPGIAKTNAFLLVFGALLGAAQPASAQFTQQGLKLVGTGAVGPAEQGYSVALSADGNTAIVSGLADDLYIGAAWLFTRSGGVWTQQGPKLVGSNAIGPASQGYSVALSAEGTTAIVGGRNDNSNIGAAWVFTAGGNAKLIGNGVAGLYSWQGKSVALSADGNTAIVGGPYDNNQVGAVWVFTQSSGVWTQQGSKLFASDAVGASSQGWSVALSADGNTAIEGGPYDGAGSGAAWVFTRSSNGAWTQQGLKLVGSGSVAPDLQGYAVALSADGNTAIVGGFNDNSGAGAAWVFTRSGSTWTQQGPKLVGSNAIGPASQGYSVALSADGNIAIVGGYSDNSGIGATWIFTRSGGVWTQQGSKLVGNGAVNTPDGAQQGSSVALSADGTTAIVGGPIDNSQAGAAWIFTAPSHIAGLLSATPTSGAAPLAVTFRAMGLPLPMTYTINFGDGTSGALSQGGCFGSRSGVQCSGSASHTYSSSRTYYATLVNASGSTLGAATITAGGNLVKPLRPPLLPRGTPLPPSPPVAISTPPPERHSPDQ